MRPLSLALLVLLGSACVHAAPEHVSRASSLIGTRWELVSQVDSAPGRRELERGETTLALIIRGPCSSRRTCQGDYRGELQLPPPRDTNAVWRFIWEGLREVHLSGLERGQDSVHVTVAPSVRDATVVLEGRWQGAEARGTFVEYLGSGPAFGHFVLRPLPQ